MATTFEPEASPPVLETPFLELSPTASTAQAEVATPFLAESPFVSEYGVGEQTIRPEEPALRELMEDLYDSEFDEVMADLVAEAETYVDALGLGESEYDQARAEQLLEAWIAPLARESESVLLGLAEAFDAEDPATVTEERCDEIFDRVVPGGAEYGPAFEGFLKSLVKKARRIAKGAASAVRKVSKLMPISIILRKLAALARPLLTRVLKFALNKLPAAYQEPAKLLARRFLGIKVAESWDELDGEDFENSAWEDVPGEAEQPATADVRELQDAFDVEAVSLVFAPSEREQDLYLAEAGAASAVSAPSRLAVLDAARKRFVDGMASLDASADPTPLVENFLPAVLPVLRLGLRVAGRPRVVRFLAQYIGRLIAPYVGPSVATGLSRAIVDAGLRVMTLEAEGETYEEASSVVAAEAFASLVEDTAARVAQLDEEDLADEALVEEAAYTAFHESAAVNFPAEVLAPESEYAESGRARGTWVPMPRRGPWRYRKYSRVFNVVIHPAAARAITTFSGRPLSSFLRERHGRTGPVRARLHLYQAVPGSSRAGIARAERGVAGLGSADARARSRLHPLTPMAAAAFIGEPGLGREVSEEYAGLTAPLAIGQRLYYLEVPQSAAEPVATGAQPAATAGAPPGAAAGLGMQPRPSDAKADVDPSAGSVTVTIYLAEADAQTIGTRLRRREPLGASLAFLRRVYGPALGGRTASGQQRIRVRSEAEDEVESEDLLRRPARFGRPIPTRSRLVRPLRMRRRGFARRRRRPGRLPLVSWIARALAAELDRVRDAFLEAADAPADGVTIVLRMRPPGLGALMTTGVVRAAAGPGAVQVEINPGSPRG